MADDRGWLEALPLQIKSSKDITEAKKICVWILCRTGTDRGQQISISTGKGALEDDTV